MFVEYLIDNRTSNIIYVGCIIIYYHFLHQIQNAYTLGKQTQTVWDSIYYT